jgi:hypothetical protein
MCMGCPVIPGVQARMFERLGRTRNSGSCAGGWRRKLRRQSKPILVVPIAGIHLFLAGHPSTLSGQSSRRQIVSRDQAARLAFLEESTVNLKSSSAATVDQQRETAQNASTDSSAPVQTQREAAEGTENVTALASTNGPMGLIPSGMEPSEAASITANHALQPTVCQVKVLNALNRRFPSANLTAANIVPSDPADRRFAVANVNIHGTPAQLASVSKGRYAPRHPAFLGFIIGYGPSLHIVSRPSFLDPHVLVFSRTAFTAHLDSAWADTPVGLFLHFVLDVLRPKSRNPCP